MKQKSTKETNNSAESLFFEVDGSTVKSILLKKMESLLQGAAYTNPMKAYEATLESMTVQSPEPTVTKEQWEQLYKLARNIRLLAPWQYLHETELITLLLPGREEPVYLVTMGQGEETYGVGIFSGYDSLRRIQRVMEAEMGEEDISVAFEQHCINLYFGDREELEPWDREVMKTLGLKFRGRGEWPYFRSMIPGFVPWQLNGEEAALVIEALQNYLMACAAYIKQDRKVDFEGGEAFLRFFDEKTETWYNVPTPMPPVPFIVPKLMVTDEVLITRLKKKKKSQKELGFSLVYLPMPMQEHKHERPGVPRMALLLDRKTGEPIAKEIAIGTELTGGAVIEMLDRYITKHGRPSLIVTKDEEANGYIETLAEKLDIETRIDKDFTSASSFMMRLMDQMELGEDEDMPSESPVKDRKPRTPSRAKQAEGATKSYVFSVSLGTGCYRHILMPGEATLEQFSMEILDAFEFENDHAHAFFMDNRAWSDADSYTVDFEEDDEERHTCDFTLDQLDLTPGRKFLYIFDFGDDWRFQCKVLKALDELTPEAMVLKAVGEAPLQYGDAYDEYEDEDYDDEDDEEDEDEEN